jgi:hypothetical protein
LNGVEPPQAHRDLGLMVGTRREGWDKLPELARFTSAIKRKKALQNGAPLAVWTRLELATSAVTGRHSNQLNYQTSSESI